MAKSKEIVDFEHVLEKIIFDEDELNELKGVVGEFAKGKVQPRQLKQEILLCRSRILEVLKEFVLFYINSKKQEKELETVDSNKQIRQELEERNKFLEIIANRINQLETKLKKKKDKNLFLRMAQTSELRCFQTSFLRKLPALGRTFL